MTARSLKSNFLINVTGAVVPLGVALVTVPIYVHQIGEARYGLLSIVWILLGYLGFLDFGLSRAAVRTLARLHRAPQAERARVLVTTLVLNLGLGLAGSAVLAGLGGYLLHHVLNVPDALRPEITEAFPWIVALFPLAMLSGVAIGTLEAREHFLLANLLGVGGMTLGQVVAVILALTVSPSLAVIIPAAAIVRIVFILLALVSMWRQERPLSLSQFDRSKARELLAFGSWMTVSGVISPVLTSLDQLVIGSLLNVASVAFYAVPMNLVVRSQLFPSALVRTLFPRFSGAEPTEARRLAARALTAIAYGYAIVCVPAVVIAPTFFRFWVGEDFALKSTSVAGVLFVGAWVNALAFVPYELVQSQGRADITGKFHLAEVVPFIAILWLLTSFFGIVGAATAWSLRCAVDAACLAYASKMPLKAVKAVALPLVMLCSACIVAQWVGTDPRVCLPLGLTAFLVAVAVSLLWSHDIRQSMSALLDRLRTRVGLGRPNHDSGDFETTPTQDVGSRSQRP